MNLLQTNSLNCDDQILELSKLYIRIFLSLFYSTVLYRLEIKNHSGYLCHWNTIVFIFPYYGLQ